MAQTYLFKIHQQTNFSSGMFLLVLLSLTPSNGTIVNKRSFRCLTAILIKKVKKVNIFTILCHELVFFLNFIM